MSTHCSEGADSAERATCTAAVLDFVHTFASFAFRFWRPWRTFASSEAARFQESKTAVFRVSRTQPGPKANAMRGALIYTRPPPHRDQHSSGGKCIKTPAGRQL